MLPGHAISRDVAGSVAASFIHVRRRSNPSRTLRDSCSKHAVDRAVPLHKNMPDCAQNMDYDDAENNIPKQFVHDTRGPVEIRCRRAGGRVHEEKDVKPDMYATRQTAMRCRLRLSRHSNAKSQGKAHEHESEDNQADADVHRMENDIQPLRIVALLDGMVTPRNTSCRAVLDHHQRDHEPM